MPIWLFGLSQIIVVCVYLCVMYRSLEQEQSLRRKAELESAQCRLQLQVVTDECGKLRREVQV